MTPTEPSGVLTVTLDSTRITGTVSPSSRVVQSVVPGSAIVTRSVPSA
jgi:hypothetical protein